MMGRDLPAVVGRWRRSADRPNPQTAPVKNPGVYSRHTVPSPQGHGVDRREPWTTVRDQTWGADANRTGLTYGHLVFSAQTRHLQLQEPRLYTGPAGQDSGQELITRPALEGLRYRFTAVNDKAVIAEAKRRAK